MKPRSNLSCLLISLAIVGSPSFCLAVHPDWGPEPPVAPFTRACLPGERSIVELIFPVIGKCRWRDDYNVNRGRYRHTGIDIRARKMSPIVAPFSGVLGMKRESFWIYGDNGWAMLGTHLNDDDLGTHNHRGSRDVMFAPDLTPGQRVAAGQFIGYVGQSGDATGPHLHFEIYAPGGGPTMGRIRDPFPSLKRAQVLTHPVGVIPQQRSLPPAGEIRLEACLRKIDPADHAVTVLLLAKQGATGLVSAVTHIRYLRLHVTDQAIAQLGGWDQLAHMSPTQTLGLCVYATDHPDGCVVKKILASSPPSLATQ